MPRQRINPLSAYTFPPGTIENSAEVDNLHNANGTVDYQIAAQPVRSIPIRPNEENFINSINGQQLIVWNNVTSAVEIVY